MSTNTQRTTLHVRSSASDSRSIRFIASTPRVARDGGIVLPTAWDVQSYLANPAFLWGHDSGALPVGRTTSIETDDDGNLIIDVEFAGEAEGHDRAETIYRLYKSGFLSAVSVGFKIHEERAPNDEERSAGARWVATKAELLEVSAVPVPSDPGALSIDRIREAHATGCLDRKDILMVRGWSGISTWNEFAKRAEEVMKMNTRTVVEAEDYFLQVIRDGATFVEGTFEEVEYPPAAENDPLIYMIVGALEDGRTVIQALKWLKADGWTVESATEWALSNEDAILDWEKPAEEDAPPPTDGEEKPEADVASEQTATGRTLSRDELVALAELLREAADALIPADSEEGEDASSNGEEPEQKQDDPEDDDTAARLTEVLSELRALRRAVKGENVEMADDYSDLLQAIRSAY